MTQKCIALLGRRDAPTDAVEEYCQYLGAALRAHDIGLELARVAWLEDGWPAALRELERQAAVWRWCNTPRCHGPSEDFHCDSCACCAFFDKRERASRWYTTTCCPTTAAGRSISCGGARRLTR